MARSSITLVASALLLSGAATAGPSAFDPIVTQVSSTGSHTCVVTTGGGVRCWGRNDAGQLGDNSTTNRDEPVDVVGLGSGIAAISAGQLHTCALTNAGAVKCWGRNDAGQLGDNSTTVRHTPVDVAGLANVAAIAAGFDHTCALTAGGGVKCWGANGLGQLGDNTGVQRLLPTDVPGLGTDVRAITAGGLHTCAVTFLGEVQCWGYNGNGQVGDGSTTTRYAPVVVPGLPDAWKAVSAGDAHTCALAAAGNVRCWGKNNSGQLGDATLTQRLTPVDVLAPGGFGGLTNIVAISAGTFHSCSLDSSGGMKCWGDNTFGELGDNTNNQHTTPNAVTGLASGVGGIATGGYHTCALIATGGVKCWGANFSSQVGDNTNTQRLAPVEVWGLRDGVANVTMGGNHSCVLTNGGGAKCWGNNIFGQLGNNSTTVAYAAVDVSGLGSGVAALSAGGGHTCALTTGGGVKCWGSDFSGQLGDDTFNTNHAVPTNVLGLASGVAKISSGGSHTCALMATGGVKCWGDVNPNGIDYTARVPQDVAGLAGIVAIASGGTHTCAITNTGNVKCWGDNLRGQLGNNSPSTLWSGPVDVVGVGGVGLLSNVIALASGQSHTCALVSGGGLKCWGMGADGQLGVNSNLGSRSPVDVLNSNGVGALANVIGVGTGNNHTCALISGGAVKCWGFNLYGGIGDNTTGTDRMLPVNVVGLSSGATEIFAGGESSIALAGRTLKSWGDHVGDGTFNRFAVPTEIRLQQSLAFNPPTLITAGIVSSLVATATATSGLGVTFDTWTPSTCAVSGNTISPIAVGLCGVRASQASLSNFAPAPQKLVLIPIVRGAQTISFTVPAGKTYGNPPFNVSTGTSSGLAVSVTSLTPAVCTSTGTNGRTITLLQSGTCTLAANQAGNATYFPADEVQRSIPVALASQTITFTALPDRPATDKPFTVAASASSLLTVAFVSKSNNVCTVFRDTVTLVAGGTCVVRAYQDGDARYAAAPQVDRSFQVIKVDQTILFGTLPNRLVGDAPFPVGAEASSGLAVSFFSSGPCTVLGNTVTIVGAGGCVIFADQPGDGRYNPAPQVTRGFSILAAFALSVSRSGAGTGGVTSNTGGIDCGTTCGANFAVGTAVILTATPAAGSAFNQWTGCDSVAGNTCNVAMNAARSVTASFRVANPVAYDWSGDNKPDIVWSNTNNGATYLWRMDGPSLISDSFITQIDPSWKIQGIADFNGDGQLDLVWRNTANGNTYVWYMNGTSLVSDAFVFALPPEWVIQGVADFNADGKPDFLMRNSVSGNAFAWFFDNNVAIGDQFLFNIDPSWKVEGVGDMNADGQPDLLFRNMASGLAFAWFTDYAASTLSLAGSTPALFGIDPVWEIVQVADWNGDGSPDFLFRNAATGLVFVWYVNGTTLAGSAFVTQIDPSWEIVPRR